jgi:broad specificity phosphatase PhoE
LAPGRTLVVVSHGLVLRAALRVLQCGGTALSTGDPPHLDNGAWMEVPLAPAAAP